MARLEARERHLRAETRRVNLIVERRYAAYRKALAHRNHAMRRPARTDNAQLAAASPWQHDRRRRVLPGQCLRAARQYGSYPAPRRFDEDVVTFYDTHSARWARTWSACSSGRMTRSPIRALAPAEAEFPRLEACFSRFLPDSDLSRLNAPARPSSAPTCSELVEAAVEARVRTGGRFDPTVHERSPRGLRPLVRAARLPSSGSPVAVAVPRASPASCAAAAR